MEVLSGEDRLIRIKSLTAMQGSKEIFYLDSLEIPDRGLFLIQGDNGSGKSTLIRCILDLHHNYTGEIEINGISPKKMSRKEIASVIAYLPQLYRSDVPILVRDYILQGSYATGRSNHDRLIADLDIEPWLDRSFCDLSGGEQQLVRIARVLGSPAAYYFLDEPDSFLSRKNRGKFLSVVDKVAQSSSVVMVSHREESGDFTSLIEWYEE